MTYNYGMSSGNQDANQFADTESMTTLQANNGFTQNANTYLSGAI